MPGMWQVFTECQLVEQTDGKQRKCSAQGRMQWNPREWMLNAGWSCGGGVAVKWKDILSVKKMDR